MPLDPHRDSVWWSAANRWASRHDGIRILSVESAGFWYDSVLLTSPWFGPEFLLWEEAEEK